MSEDDAITPLKMLDDFQKFSDPWLIEQARQFGLLPPAKQRELLFWMIMNNGIDLQGIKDVTAKLGGGRAPMSDLKAEARWTEHGKADQ
jgi:hypothetical protein